MIFTVFTKDNIDKISKSNEATKYFHGTSICAFQSMKPFDDGIARRYTHNGLVGTVGDFPLPQSYTNVPPLLKKYRKYSCTLPTINIQEYVCCELILKDHQNEEVIWMKHFLSSETTAKHGWSSYYVEKEYVPTPINSNSSIFTLSKDVHTPDIQHYLIKLCIEYTNTLNSQQVTTVDCLDQPIYIPCKIIQWKYLEFTFPKYFALFGALYIETELLMANGHLVGLDEILVHTSIDTVIHILCWYIPVWKKLTKQVIANIFVGERTFFI